MMDERSLPVKNKTAKHSMDALLKLPGISQAIEVVHNAVWERAVDQMIGDIAAGQLGTEVQNAMKESGDFGTVLDIDIVQDRQADLEDEYLELAALESRAMGAFPCCGKPSRLHHILGVLPSTG
jgi:hypothetical protein